jgi:hypothetical protein
MRLFAEAKRGARIEANSRIFDHETHETHEWERALTQRRKAAKAQSAEL